MRRNEYMHVVGSVAALMAATPLWAQPVPPKGTAIAAAMVPAAPTVRGGPMIPQTILLRTLTPKEAEANAIWSLRAGLNVAALQCQFSPFLATVRTYNDLLKQHSAELSTAQAGMLVHFKRYDGKKSLNSFDQYSTKIYNSYSTLDAQYAFCEAAALAGRGALMIAKGQLGKYALVETPALRLSLTPPPASSLFQVDAQPVPLPPIG